MALCPFTSSNFRKRLTLAELSCGKEITYATFQNGFHYSVSVLLLLTTSILEAAFFHTSFHFYKTPACQQQLGEIAVGLHQGCFLCEIVWRQACLLKFLDSLCMSQRYYCYVYWWQSYSTMLFFWWNLCKQCGMKKWSTSTAFIQKGTQYELSLSLIWVNICILLSVRVCVCVCVQETVLPFHLL